MARPDMNLLTTLDVLLQEGSVVRAARKLRLSPSAMSRALARLRGTVGDPLLVRAGRGLAPTPRAIELRDRVRELVQDAGTILRPAELHDLGSLERTFVLRTSDGFVESFGPGLLARVAREAPRVRLRLVRKLDKDSASLRDGLVDLETGVIDKSTGPELRAQPLFRDHFIGIVRVGHALAGGPVGAEAYAAYGHVVVSSGGRGGHVETALRKTGLERRIAATVDGYSAAAALVRETDFVATVAARHSAGLRAGLHAFALPFEVSDVMVSMLWHPRMDSDPAHRWLRSCVRDICVERHEVNP